MVHFTKLSSLFIVLVVGVYLNVNKPLSVFSPSHVYFTINPTASQY